MVKHKIWTMYYNAFTMGGSCERPMLAEVDCTGPYDLGKGYIGYIAVSPLTANTYVVESTTGAIVGNALGQVKYDIAVASEEVMKSQIEDACKLVSKAEHITAEVFWTRMLRTRE